VVDTIQIHYLTGADKTVDTKKFNKAVDYQQQVSSKHHTTARLSAPLLGC